MTVLDSFYTWFEEKNLQRARRTKTCESHFYAWHGHPATHSARARHPESRFRVWGQCVHGVTSSLLELARELGFTEEQVHQIRIENPNSLQDQSHALLRHWLERDCRHAAGRAAGGAGHAHKTTGAGGVKHHCDAASRTLGVNTSGPAFL